MAIVNIDPTSFRTFAELYAANDDVRDHVHNMTNEQIIELIEDNLNYDDLTAVINEAENAALSQLED